MRAVVYSETGPSSVMRLVERPTPEPGPGQVRVRNIRSGVNPADWKARSGATNVFLAQEISPGMDGSGVVDALGEGVDSLTVGQRVWTFGAHYADATGTAAEYSIVVANRVAPLPDNASFDLGASLGVPGLTAWKGLTGSTQKLTGSVHDLAGMTVLVHGGAGAVANAAIQLSRWAGATVITTVSTPEKAELASAAGADHVVSYREPGVLEAIRDLAPDGVDYISEVAPAMNMDLNIAVAKQGARIGVYANDGGDALTLLVRSAYAQNITLDFYTVSGMSDTGRSRAAAELNEAVADGAYGVGADHGLPLHHMALRATAAAHDRQQSGVVGKIVIDVTED
jgi:NADPH2:quinone reductase